MENTKIKKFYKRKSKDAQEILVKIIEDSLLCLYNQEIIKDKTLNRVISFYFLLIDYEYEHMIEFDDFEIEEKKLLYKIIIDGIVSVYVDNEYLEYSDIGTKYKQKIIQELLSFFKYLTRFSEDKVFAIYTREVKKYRMRGFNWDNTHTSILKATKTIVVRIKGRKN